MEYRPESVAAVAVAAHAAAVVVVVDFACFFVAGFVCLVFGVLLLF